MPISSPGVGSGLDIGSLVTQLVAAERAPMESRIRRMESDATVKLSAFGNLRAALEGLDKSLAKLTGGDAGSARKATVPEGAGFTATASSGAPVGSYAVEVVSLAAAHKLASGAFAEGVDVGTGTLTIEAGEHSFAIDLQSGAASIDDIRDAINAQADGRGVVASVIRGDDGLHLVLTATDPGSAGAIRVTASGGDGGLSALVYDPGVQESLTVKQAATDAVVRVDGIERTASGNTFTDLIEDVSLTLTRAEPGKTYTLGVENDLKATRETVQGFVNSYNAALSFLRSSSAYNAATQTAAALTGDASVRAVTQQLRTTVGDAFGELSALGISSDKNGTLTLDAGKFDAALAADPQAVQRLFADDGSFGRSMADGLALFIDDEGLIDSRTDALNARLKDATRQRDMLEVRMAKVEDMYLKQFTAMDTLVAQLQSTSSFLTQQLANLPRIQSE